jgi:hypothetical protein
MPVDDPFPPYWESPFLTRMHPRLAAEMMLDAQDTVADARTIAESLRGRGFSPDFVRTKGYVDPPYAVAVLPFYSRDMTAVASLSVRRNVADLDDPDVAARGTIVRLAGAAMPIDFTILVVDEARLADFGPIPFAELTGDGVANVLRRLGVERTVQRFSKGLGLAPLVLEDMVRDELKLNFLSPSEGHRMLSDASLYSELASLHAHLGRAAARPGCSACCSSSCYGCTSCSCHINIALR